jgi:hypothetical protein
MKFCVRCNPEAPYNWIKFPTSIVGRPNGTQGHSYAIQINPSSYFRIIFLLILSFDVLQAVVAKQECVMTISLIQF